MSQIKEKQEEKERGEWENLAAEQRQEQEGLLRQLGMLARFHNIMGNDTIHSLEMISREIKNIFTHSAMVDRVSAMLNYFLLHLVSFSMNIVSRATYTKGVMGMVRRGSLQPGGLHKTPQDFDVLQQE